MRQITRKNRRKTRKNRLNEIKCKLKTNEKWLENKWRQVPVNKASR